MAYGIYLKELNGSSGNKVILDSRGAISNILETWDAKDHLVGPHKK